MHNIFHNYMLYSVVQQIVKLLCLMTGQGKKDGYNNEEISSSRLNADIDKGFVGYMEVPSIRDNLFPIINIYQCMLFR